MGGGKRSKSPFLSKIVSQSILSSYILHPLAEKASAIRKAALMATLGTNQFSAIDLQHMFEAGLNVVKFRVSNRIGVNTNALHTIRNAKKICCVKHCVNQWPSATAISLRTDVFRTGILSNNLYQIKIEEGSTVTLTSDYDYSKLCDNSTIFVDNPCLSIETQIGQKISIDFNLIILECVNIVNSTSVECVVTRGGFLRSLSEVCIRHDMLKNNDLNIDTNVINFVWEYNIDIVCINFVRNLETLLKVKNFFKSLDHMPLIFITISTLQELNIIDDLLKECDGIELERDIMTFTMDEAMQMKWIQIQKWVIAKCTQVGKPCYLTGGVFNSTMNEGIMKENELSDVTNALLDGVSGFCINNICDVVNGIEVLKIMDDLCRHVEFLEEAKIDLLTLTNRLRMPLNAAEGTLRSCVAAAINTKAKFIILPTLTGKTARTLFGMKPPSMIVVVSTKKYILRSLYAYSGIMPLLYEEKETIPETYQTRILRRLLFAEQYVVKRGFMVPNDFYVVLRRSCEWINYCDSVSVHVTKRHSSLKTNAMLLL